MRQKMERETEEWWPQRRMRRKTRRSREEYMENGTSQTAPPAAHMLLCQLLSRSAINVLVAAALAENKVAAARPR